MDERSNNIFKQEGTTKVNTDRKILAVDNDENALYNLRQGIHRNRNCR